MPEVAVSRERQCSERPRSLKCRCEISNNVFGVPLHIQIECCRVHLWYLPFPSYGIFFTFASVPCGATSLFLSACSRWRLGLTNLGEEDSRRSLCYASGCFIQAVWATFRGEGILKKGPGFDFGCGTAGPVHRGGRKKHSPGLTGRRFARGKDLRSFFLQHRVRSAAKGACLRVRL